MTSALKTIAAALLAATAFCAHANAETVLRLDEVAVGEIDPAEERKRPSREETKGKTYLMEAYPRLRPMPEAPTLIDFFRHRFGPSQHLVQSANLALKNGLDEKVVLACLLHDIAVFGLIRSDHGYWGAQLIEPYVDEEVSWAVRAHQAR